MQLLIVKVTMASFPANPPLPGGAPVTTGGPDTLLLGSCTSDVSSVDGSPFPSIGDDCAVVCSNSDASTASNLGWNRLTHPVGPDGECADVALINPHWYCPASGACAIFQTPCNPPPPPPKPPVLRTTDAWEGNKTTVMLVAGEILRSVAMASIIPDTSTSTSTAGSTTTSSITSSTTVSTVSTVSTTTTTTRFVFYVWIFNLSENEDGQRILNLHEVRTPAFYAITEPQASSLKRRVLSQDQ